ncbi:MAG: malto-oligosyltrehalose trehalohydrolase [Myxococcales bacterium]|nr:malto-oligosyltrehalose trehalohydrolase [Myxococcales bacterium]
MRTLEVWAPLAERADVVVGEVKIPMHADGDGWHRATDARFAPGVDYWFSLDGGAHTPDPRSREQPAGPHGPSRIVDLGSFPWTDAGFSAPPLGSGAVYELHLGTFSPQGTFEGAAERLTHLVNLGVTHVSLMPVADFPGQRGWGYDGVGLWAVHRAYGGPQGLMRFVDACHARGLGVLLDVVYNHLGPDGNYLGRFAPYFTDEYRTPWGQAVNLDGAGSDEVRRFFCDNACAWLTDYHVDGLRLDAVHAYYDRSALHFLEELRQRVAERATELGRRLVLVAESDLNDPRLLWPDARGGYGLDAQWSDDLHHALHAWLSGERAGYYVDFGEVEHVAEALAHAFVYRGQKSVSRGRRHGRSADGLGADRFFAYAQTHDQIGNRALGERLVALAGHERAKIAAGLVLTSPFVPMVFQGEEWAASTPFLYFTDHTDLELGQAVSKGRRQEFAAFGWPEADVPDPQSEETFVRSRLVWTELDREPHRAMLDWHKCLLALRQERSDLRNPDLGSVRVSVGEALRIERERTTIVASLSPSRTSLRAGKRGVLLASQPNVTLSDGVLQMPGDSLAVIDGGYA